MNNSLIIIAHNIRSAHNIGALMRTSEGLGVDKIFLTGYTPHPAYEGDTRLPHVSQKISQQIKKTALGAEQMIDWEYESDIELILNNLKNDGFVIAGLEQTTDSVALSDLKPPDKLAVILGSEVTGIEKSLYGQIDCMIEIPMAGQKESFNVVAAATMLIYHCKYVA